MKEKLFLKKLDAAKASQAVVARAFSMGLLMEY